jgi:putative phosphoribosyl transferase
MGDSAVEPFVDRRAAGRELAAHLAAYAGRDDVVVLGLPRGGVPVAYEVARALGAPLDMLVVRKLGVPGHEELAMGAIASGGVRVRNEQVIASTGVDDDLIEAVAEHERTELERREHAYRGERAPAEVADRTVIVVDDGLATGATMRAAVRALRQRHAAAIVVAVPIAASPVCAELGEIVDQVVCVRTPDPFVAIGLWYRDFAPTGDDEVRGLIDAAADPDR